MTNLHLAPKDVQEKPSDYSDFVRLYGELHLQAARFCALASDDSRVDEAFRYWLKDYDCYEVKQGQDDQSPVLGMVILDRSASDSVKIEDLIIDRTKRNMGLGRAALDLIINDVVNDTEREQLFLQPTINATSFYARAGFVFDTKSKYMELDLAAARTKVATETAAKSSAAYDQSPEQARPDDLQTASRQA